MKRKIITKNSEDLIPPDPKCCQAEVPNGYSFMTLGGVPGRERCNKKPSVIVSELVPGKDGKCGSMSLCDDCLIVFRKQMPKGKFKTTHIRKTMQPMNNEMIMKNIIHTLCEEIESVKSKLYNTNGELAELFILAEQSKQIVDGMKINFNINE